MPEDKTETPSDEEVKDQKPSDEATDKVDPAKYVTRDELAKVIAERDAEKKKRRAIEEQIRADKTKSGDVESVRAGYEEQIAELKRDSEATLSKYQRAVLDAEVKRQLADVVIDPDTAFLLLRDSVELHDDGDSLSPRIKNSGLSIAEYAAREFKKTGKDYLLKSSRKAGTETNKGENKGETAPITLEDYDRMTPLQQKLAAAKNPKLVSEIIRSAKS